MKEDILSALNYEFAGTGIQFKVINQSGGDSGFTYFSPVLSFDHYLKRVEFKKSYYDNIQSVFKRYGLAAIFNANGLVFWSKLVSGNRIDFSTINDTDFYVIETKQGNVFICRGNIFDNNIPNGIHWMVDTAYTAFGNNLYSFPEEDIRKIRLAKPDEIKLFWDNNKEYEKYIKL